MARGFEQTTHPPAEATLTASVTGKLAHAATYSGNLRVSGSLPCPPGPAPYVLKTCAAQEGLRPPSRKCPQTLSHAASPRSGHRWLRITNDLRRRRDPGTPTKKNANDHLGNQTIDPCPCCEGCSRAQCWAHRDLRTGRGRWPEPIGPQGRRTCTARKRLGRAPTHKCGEIPDGRGC